MPESPPLLDLKARLSQLDQLLPAVGKVEAYSQEELDRTLAYRLLAHAEIEHCLEALVLLAADRACKGWLGDPTRVPRKTIVCLFAYHGPPVPMTTDKSLKARQPEMALRKRLEEAKKAFSASVDANNGITQRDLFKLLLPAGVSEADINSGWLATTHSFGVARGSAAHNTYGKVAELPDPGSEQSNVAQIVAGLSRIDELLQAACEVPSQMVA